MDLDAELEERIWAIVDRLRARVGGEREPMRAGARKQAHVPVGAVVLEPVGTAPGFIVGSSPLVVVLPGPPRELQTMWRTRRVGVEPLRGLLASAGALDRRILRFFGLPEPEIAATLRELDADSLPLEITTCLRRGELEVATVFSRPVAVVRVVRGRVARTPRRRAVLGRRRTIDEVVASLLLGPDDRHRRIVHGRADGGAPDGPARGPRRTSSGGLVVYSNEAKTALAGVPAELIEAHGAVSPEVASALAAGARLALGADIGIGITGIAGPGGGTPEKPVGTVCLCVSSADDVEERVVRLPGLARGRARPHDDRGDAHAPGAAAAP